MDKYTFKQNYTCEITGKQYKANDKIYEKNNMLFTSDNYYICDVDSEYTNLHINITNKEIIKNNTCITLHNDI